MARIAGIDLPKEKRIEIGLTYIYGIGRTSANKILAQAGISPDVRVKDLSEEDEAKLREIIGHDYTVEGDLRRNVAMDIKRLTEIGCYRGIRHRKGAACPRPAFQDERPYPQGSQAYRRQQEEVRRDTHGCKYQGVRKWCVSAASVKRGEGPGAYPFLLQ